MIRKRKIPGIVSMILLLCLLGGCGKEVVSEPEVQVSEIEASESKSTQRTADIAVLYTGDVHSAVDENIGYAGLAAFKKQLMSEGCEVLLADSGDAIQGTVIGSYSQGESIIKIMNHLGYSAMALGNHEFDYGGTEQLVKLSELAEFPFVSSNFFDMETGETVYEPYTMVERDGVKIAFVGVTTPRTITSSTPTYFMDDEGEFIYDFLTDETGEALWENVQASVDSARSEGADYVIALTHLGIFDEGTTVYTSNNLIAHTTGIDVVLDGHSHSVVDCARVKNKEGNRVLLSSTGTKLLNIGYLLIDRNGNLSTGLVSDVEEKDEEVTALITELREDYAEEMNRVAAHLETALVTEDPETGVRIVRSAETNLGDLCADAYRAAGDADIAFINGGGVRAPLPAGDVTYEDIFTINPFGNLLCKVKVKGQTILDALEFGVSVLPEESGGFLQVSGLTFEIHMDTPSSVVMDENEMFVAVDGEYRVQNVMVNGEPLELSKDYTLVSHNYMLKNLGDGYTMFESAEMMTDEFIVDADALIEYMNNEYKENTDMYTNPYGDGRIIAVE